MNEAGFSSVELFALDRRLSAFICGLIFLETLRLYVSCLYYYRFKFLRKL